MVISTPADFVNGAMQRRARQVGFELQSGLLDLAIISRVAAMLGFLGTALSVLVVVFRTVDPPENWTVLSAASCGIYFGLMPMLFGLGTGLLPERNSYSRRTWFCRTSNGAQSSAYWPETG